MLGDQRLVVMGVSWSDVNLAVNWRLGRLDPLQGDDVVKQPLEGDHYGATALKSGTGSR